MANLRTIEKTGTSRKRKWESNHPHRILGKYDTNEHMEDGTPHERSKTNAQATRTTRTTLTNNWTKQYEHLGQSRRTSAKTSRLHRDKQQIQECSQKGMGGPTMKGGHGATEAACQNQTRNLATLARNYHKKSPPETGRRVKYDITALRTEPGKLEKWYKDTEPIQERQRNWGRLKQKIQQGLQECYPTKTQTKQTPKPDNLDNNATNSHWGNNGRKRNRRTST